VRGDNQPPQMHDSFDSLRIAMLKSAELLRF
jgi:hypothetical protein